MILGHIDYMDPYLIRGWWNTSYRMERIGIYVNDRLHKEIEKFHYRKDIDDLNIVEGGSAGFEESISINYFDKVSIRPIGDNIITNVIKYLIPDGFLNLHDALQIEELKALLEPSPLSLLPEHKCVLAEDVSIKLMYSFNHKKHPSAILWRVRQNSNYFYYVQYVKSYHTLYRVNCIHRFVSKTLPKNVNVPNLLTQAGNHFKKIQYYEYIPGKVLDTIDAYNITVGESKLIVDAIKSIAKLSTIKVDTWCNKALLFRLWLKGIQKYVLSCLWGLLASLFHSGVSVNFPVYLKLIKYYMLNLKLSHGDFHRKNLIINEDINSISILDWDMFGYHPFGTDILYFVMHLPNEELRKDCLQKYIDCFSDRFVEQRILITDLALDISTRNSKKSLKSMAAQKNKLLNELNSYFQLQIK